MAAVTVLSGSGSFFSHTSPAGVAVLPTYSGGQVNVMQCYFSCAFTGTYVQGTGFTISWANDLVAGLGASKRSGSTFKIWDVSAVGTGLEGATNAIVLAGACVNTSGTATTGLLYGPDGATEHAAAVMGAFSKPLTFVVTYLEQLAA